MTTEAWQFQERVDRGAKLLDSKLPGWEQKVNLDRLALVSACDCALGQLGVDLGASCADYHAAAPFLFGEFFADQAEWYGFVLISDEETRPDNWDALTDCWKQTILRKRAEATV